MHACYTEVVQVVQLAHLAFCRVLSDSNGQVMQVSCSISCAQDSMQGTAVSFTRFHACLQAFAMLSTLEVSLVTYIEVN